ncbi:unnamed protein product [Ostreobium quekettii]|uniref:Ammonium transporter AmtB-like domain-containing protein n=1 Tax=Ostreobium quekettii TaxID=121088 RepID=A0A8S1IR96_9CHLO|nr:unnamed protein product [Ostreobium quekettii]
MAITGFVYPVAVHWGWSAEGWLSAFRVGDDGNADPSLGANGLIDFAGSGVVHVTGGAAALMAAYFVGPRAGRFNPDGTVNDMPGQATVLSVAGTFILWFGWYGFNPVSTLVFVDSMAVATRVAVTTTISAAAGGITSLAVHVLRRQPPDLPPTLNGILAGLVGVTAGCPVVDSQGAFAIGIISAFVYTLWSEMLKRLRIDDPLDASSVHMASGIWGVIAVGLFATESNTCSAGYASCADDYGAFYGGGGRQLGVQLAGAFGLSLWSLAMSTALFGLMALAGVLRVSKADEAVGLDFSHHGGAAYFGEGQIAASVNALAQKVLEEGGGGAKKECLAPTSE